MRIKQAPPQTVAGDPVGSAQRRDRSHNIEDTYPLSPMQQGMLFHSLADPESGVYITQVTCTLVNLNVPALQQAWRQVMERHSILRTAFVWKNLERPLQVVGRQVGLPLAEEDWRDLSSTEQEARFQAYLQADQARGFQFTKAPLMRLALFQVADDTYKFAWSHHHILLDGWSVHALIKEVFTLYTGFCDGKTLPLAASPPYRDYIAWLQQQDFTAAKQFWQTTLRGFTAPTSLLTDRAAGHNPGRTNEFAADHIEQQAEARLLLSATATAALRTFAQQQQLTLNTLVQGALALLLSRYSGEDDITFGAVVSGRPPELTGIEAMVGLFINTLPVRVQVTPDAPLVAWLQQLQEQQVEMRRYEYSPLIEIQGWSDVPRDLPLFRTIYAFENYPVDAPVLEQGLALDVHDYHVNERVNYPLTIVAGARETLTIKVLYDCRHFAAPTVTRLLGHVQTLLEGMVANPRQRLADLSLLTAAERRQLLYEWNDTAIAYPQERSIPTLFEEQVARTPDAIALVFDEATLTYGELNRRANQLAHYLQKLTAGSPLGPEVLVGICMERSLEMVVGILAILKAGGAYLPLDPTYPQERLAFMLADTGAPVLLTQAHLAAQLPVTAAQMICVDAEWTRISQESDQNPTRCEAAEQLAYVMYTSGSTGRPKGIAIPHRAINRLVFNTNYIQMRPDDRMALVSNSAFDAATFELWGALLHGARLIGISKEVALSPYEFAVQIREQGINTMFLTTALFNRMAHERPDAFAAMRNLLFGGEAADPHAVRIVLNQHSPERLLNVYGPTESTTFTTWYPVLEVASSAASVPIGRPIANTQVYILDRHLHPTPLGVAGELYIGGDGLARGYLNRPALTAERFVPNPFSTTQAGERLYRTGDLVRYRPSPAGAPQLEFLGRIDHQVKLRGFRIELGEIEATLAQHPAVQEVAVLVREDASLPGAGDKRLVAYLVCPEAEAPSARELRTFVQQHLPDYMTPSAFVILDAFPLNPNGKVDRKALPAPGDIHFDHEALIAPRTPIEELLADLWSRVLGVNQVSIDTSFFDLGGHSLLATQLVSRIRDTFGVELPLRELFEAPTVAALATRIAAVMQAAQGVAAPPLEAAPRDKELPLSFAQQRLWFLDRLAPGDSFYNIAAALRLHGELNVAALEASFNTLVQRHTILRTAFPDVAGRAVQVIAPATPVALTQTDLRHLSPDEREEALSALSTETAQQPFDLTQTPLFRLLLVQLADDDHALLLTMHHIITDGWSMGVLVREVATLYTAYCQEQANPLPPLPVQYADFAHWQRQWLQGEVLAQQLAYWTQRLQGSSFVLQLPTDRPRPAVQRFRGAAHPLRLAPELSAALAEFSRREGVTLFMTLLAAFQTLLHRYSGQDDILVGTPIANRTHSELEGLIGFFVNTLVLRADLGANPTFRDLLRQVRQHTLDAYAHQALPFEQLVDALQPARNLSHSPLFQVMFVLQNAPRGALELPGLRLRALPTKGEAAKFDLSLFLTDTTDGLAGNLEYNTDLFDASTIARLAGHFERLLAAVVAHPQQRVAALPLLTPAEQHQWLVAVNATDTVYPTQAPLPLWFEAQAAHTPAAIAVTDQGEAVTYADLNRRVNQLAHYLRAAGVGPDTLVGVCTERSLAMLVGLLGVLKAGGAYVPLDPGYPPARLAFMLADTAAPILLTQAHLLGRLPAHQARVVCLDRDWPEIALYRTANPAPLTAPDQLAYVIYTSGSTGQPKGALITHAGLTNYLNWCLHAYPLAEGQGALVHSTFAFDATVTGLFAPLVAGRAVHLLPEAADPAALGQALRTLRDLSLVKITPAHLTLLNQQLSPTEARGLTRAFVIGGENLVAEQIAFWQQHAPDTRLFNEYGPTETVVGCVVYEAAGWRGHGSVPIGRVIPGMRVYVLDRYGQPVPAGVRGELYLGGVGVARGYLHRPDLTAEQFVPDPFSGEAGARLYRTGDLVRYLPDGELEFLGRIDHQVKVRGYRIELGEIEAVLAHHPAVQETAVIAHTAAAGQPQLVAYVAGEQAPTAAELRTFVQQQLPDYMVPVRFVTVDALPLTANGKVDRKALPALDPTDPAVATDFVAPRTPAETQLAAIWAQVLGLPLAQVGVHDNFFELGGDSILSIQIIARANAAGLHLTPRQLFQHQTVAALAAVAGTAKPIVAEQGAVIGPAPLTPIQQWFFSQEFPDPHHWNQAVLLEVRERLAPPLVERALQHLLHHHDALRLRFVQEGDDWRQSFAAPTDTIPFTHIDLTTTAPAERSAAITAQAAAWQATLDLTAGPLLRVALLDLGPDAGERLLLVIHHLVMDGVSWRILLEDLHTLYQQLAAGAPVQLPPKTTSFQQWAQRLTAYAQSPAVVAERTYWLDDTRRTVVALPVDKSHTHSANTEATAHTISLSLSVEETRALLQEAPQAYHTQINDLLLTALTQTLSRWSGATAVLVNLEGHGREDLLADVDLSRTVGWFTTVFPVLLTLADGSSDPGAAIKAVKEQLCAIPNRGLGYGLLRYLGDAETRAQLAALPQAAVSFNYLGQFDQALPPNSPFAPARESSGAQRSPRGQRQHLLDIVGSIAGGRLQLTWIYSEQVHMRTTVEALAADFVAALRTLLIHCQSPAGGGYTPSDFPLARLDQQRLDRVLGNERRIADLYPLTPMQQGMLFHSLYAPGSGVYVEQISCTLRGELDVTAFAGAWQTVVDRHPVLRTAFVWEGVAEPLQVVRERVTLPLEQHDWRALAASEQAARLTAFLETTAHTGFDLSRAPLLRLALMRTADDAYRFVFLFHHLLLDGWSVALLFKELFLAYGALSQEQGVLLEPSQPYHAYIAWLQRQDLTKAETFWRQTLRGFTTPTPLAIARTERGAAGESGYAKQRLVLSGTVAGALQALARRHRLTFNTLVQGAWALLLSRYSGEEEVLFGATVAGRPAELPGVEAMLGLFINTLPVRVRVTPAAPLLGWLQQLQAEQIVLRQYEYTPLVQIAAWSEMARGTPLFESLVVFENYPVDRSLSEQKQALEVVDVHTVERTNYPLTVVASGGAEGLALRIDYDRQRFDEATVERLLGHLSTLLTGMVAHPDHSLADLPILSTAEEQQLLVTWNGQRNDAPLEESIHQLLETQVVQTPDALALAFGDDGLSYRTFNGCVNQLAHYLRTLGVGPEVLVGVCIERSLELMVALLGVLKAGGAYVPLDPNYPAERLAYMLDDANVTVLLTQERLLAQLPPHRAHTLCLDRDWALIAAQPTTNPMPVATPDNLAYVIYTSGSTGRPKGVLITQRGLTNYLHWCLTAYPVTAGRGSVVHATIAFDATITALFPPLLAGRTVRLLPEVLDLDALSATLLAEGDYSLVKITPAHLDLLRHQLTPEQAATLTHAFVIGGENLLGEQIRFWQEHAPHTQLFNEYGPTETVVGCIVYDAPCDRPVSGSVPIGRPIPNTTAYVLDHRLHLVPVGAVGELYLGGVGVARGYLGRPELTAEKFIPDPFRTEAGGQGAPRLYKTGDLVRYLADGNLEYLGRVDDQVKIRGYRVECGEVEAVLSQHPALRDVAVVARELAPGDRRLVAYCVPATGEAMPAHSVVRDFVGRQLPEYMTPAFFVELAALPLTSNGKLDRRALPAPEMVRPELKAPYVAPCTPLEETVAGIWAKVLRVERVGVHDHFFELGGHSLLATQVISRIKQACDVQLPLRYLFETPTVAGLATSIEAVRWAVQSAQLAAAEANHITENREEGEL